MRTVQQKRVGGETLPFTGSRIDPTRLAFDFDGVFADTMHLFLEIAHQEFQVDSIRYEDITCYDLESCIDMDPGIIHAVLEQILEGSHIIPLRPMNEAPWVISRILRRHAPVLFVTARTDPKPVLKWMKEVLGQNSSGIEIMATGAYDRKAEVLLDRSVSYFVEDRLETCFALDAAGVKPIVYRQPWNRTLHPFPEVGSWEEIQRLIDI